MDWYAIGLAAACGGLAPLIANLIFWKFPDKKTGYTTVVIILFVGLNALSRQFILPELNVYKTESEIEASFDDIPVLASIKKYEPETYQHFVDSLIEARKKSHNPQQLQQVADSMRAKIARMVESRISHASDDAIVAYLNVIVREMGELQTQGDGLCYKLLFPEVAGGIEVQKLFSQETQDRDMAALDEILKTSNEKRYIPAENEVRPYIEVVFENLYTKFGDDVSIIENPTASGIDKEKVCSITKGLYAEILKLSTEHSVPTLRWLFRQA